MSYYENNGKGIGRGGRGFWDYPTPTAAQLRARAAELDAQAAEREAQRVNRLQRDNERYTAQLQYAVRAAHLLKRQQGLSKAQLRELLDWLAQDHKDTREYNQSEQASETTYADGHDEVYHKIVEILDNGVLS